MKRKNGKISNAVIRRLPRYRRYLRELQKQGVEKISSNDFSELIGYTAVSYTHLTLPTTMLV